MPIYENTLLSRISGHYLKRLSSSRFVGREGRVREEKESWREERCPEANQESDERNDSDEIPICSKTKTKFKLKMQNPVLSCMSVRALIQVLILFQSYVYDKTFGKFLNNNCSL